MADSVRDGEWWGRFSPHPNLTDARSQTVDWQVAAQTKHPHNAQRKAYGKQKPSL